MEIGAAPRSLLAHLRKNGVVFVAIILAALWFWRVPFSNFADADSYLAHVSVIPTVDHVSVARAYDEVVTHYRNENPGWFPVAPIPLAIWFFDPMVRWVKLLQYVLVVATFPLFASIVRRLTGSAPASIAAVALALCAWQFRAPHDPVVGTSLLTPWSADLSLLSFVGWLRYRDSGRLAWLVVALTSLICATLTGIVAWGLGITLAALALLDRDRRFVGALFLAATTLSIAVACFIAAPQPPWHHAGAYLRNVAAQIFAALPTSARAVIDLPLGHVPPLSHNLRYVDDRFINIPQVSLEAWLAIVACTIAILVSVFSLSESSTAKQEKTALLLGLALWIVPAACLGAPNAWHQGLPFGQSFESVYLEYLGVGLIAALALRRMRAGGARLARVVPMLAALAVFTTCYGNARADAVVLARAERHDAPGGLMQRAAVAGFFGQIPEGSTIAVASSLPFANGVHARISDAKYAFYHYAHRRFDIIPIERLGDRPQRKVWILRTSGTSGIFVSLSHWAGRRGSTLLADRAYGYTVFPGVWQAALEKNRGMAATTTSLTDGRAIAVRRTCGPVPVDIVFAASRPTLSWQNGFFREGPYGYSLGPYAPAPWGAGALRIGGYPRMIMEAHGTLIIHPTSCPPGHEYLRADSVATAPGILDVRVRGRLIHIPVSPSATTFTIDFDAGRAPALVHFSTDAPPGTLDRIVSRYERDRPRDQNLAIKLDDLWESASLDSQQAVLAR